MRTGVIRAPNAAGPHGASSRPSLSRRADRMYATPSRGRLLRTQARRNAGAGPRYASRTRTSLGSATWTRNRVSDSSRISTGVAMNTTTRWRRGRICARSAVCHRRPNHRRPAICTNCIAMRRQPAWLQTPARTTMAPHLRIIAARHEVRRQARTLSRIEHQPRGVRAARRREVSHPGQQRNGEVPGPGAGGAL